MKTGALFVCSSWTWVFMSVWLLQFATGDGAEKYLGGDANGDYCVRESGKNGCSRGELHRIDDNEVGVIEIVEDGTILEMTALSTEPLVLEIRKFLTDEECDHFIKVANQEGLFSSVTSHGDYSGDFQVIDSDQDMKLSLQEMRQTIINSFDVYLLDDDVLHMYKALELDKNGDAYITQEELGAISPAELGHFLKTYLKDHPEKHSRMSSQVWYNPDEHTGDEIFNRVQRRVQKIVKLPERLIKSSDFQIVKYNIKGHYNAHWDSSPLDKNLQCCNRGARQHCRTCRYMTVLFYLTDVESGGETAFPTAGTNQTYCKNFIGSLETNLYEKCDSTAVKVVPEKGKAALWYNHYIDAETGGLGELDECTWHGGCPVKKGEKWIANFWIKFV